MFYLTSYKMAKLANRKSRRNTLARNIVDLFQPRLANVSSVKRALEYKQWNHELLFF